MAESSEKWKNVRLKCYSDSDEDEGENEVDWGFSMERLNLTQKNLKKKLLVMGLGGFLCHRVFRLDSSKIPTCRPPDAIYGSFLVYKRPYCEEFMKFCLERFEVGIWSAAREWNLNDALNAIMSGLKGKVLFAWDQDECIRTEFKDLVKKQKPIFLKDLKKLWGEQGAKLLGLGKQQFSSSNTLLIDHDPHKSLLNPPHTAIFPTEYKADQVGDKVLGDGGELRLYLEELAEAEDIPSFVKKHSYGKPAISPLHVDWDYYSKIINKYHKK